MTEIIDEKTVLKFNKNILKRYEHNLNGGTMILYDVETEALWFGNSASKELVEGIDGGKNIKEIYKELLPLYEGKDMRDIIESFNLIIEDLFNKNFLN
jgi:hypothetical protein